MFPSSISRARLATVLLLALTTAPAAAQTVTQLWNFTSIVSPEGSALLPDGCYLFATENSSNVYIIDPQAADPVAEVVGVLPGAIGVLGIAHISDVKYGIIGTGSHASGDDINATLYTIDFSDSTTTDWNGTVGIGAVLPNAEFLNGAAPLPEDATIVFLCDSFLGAIWRVDTNNGNVSVAMTSDLWLVPDNSTTGVPIGINGLKTRAGYAYWTNTAAATLGRARITDNGTFTGEVEIIAYGSDAGTSPHFNDLYVIDDDGTSLVSDFHDVIAKICPNGTVDNVVVDALLLEPSSIQVLNDTVWYVTTHGSLTESSQIAEIHW